MAAVDPTLLNDLRARGLVQDTTDPDALTERLAADPITVYAGFDPTAPSLHVGNMIGLLALRRFQLAGHRVVSLAGGATGMVGDPSGKSSERNLQDDDSLSANLAGIVPQLRQFLEFETSEYLPAKLLDNRAWTVGLTMLDFMRDVGKYVTVNQMVARDSIRSRMESEEGISYTEFSYMLLQAHDYAWLHENEGVELQIGGSDQWGNIAAGVDLVRRRTQQAVHGLTWPLLLRKDGTKYGKTAGGETIWLSGELMSPYRFYQAWVSVDDQQIEELLLKLTLLEVAECRAIAAEHAEAPHLRVGQRRLASELTELVHGEVAMRGAAAASEVVFGKGTVDDLDEVTLGVLAGELPGGVIPRSQLGPDGDLATVLVEAGVAKSKSEVGRLLDQGGLTINDQRVPVGTNYIDPDDLACGRYAMVRRGKRQIFLVEFAD